MRHSGIAWLLIAVAFMAVSPVSLAAKSKIDFWWGEASDWDTQAIREIISDFESSHPWAEVSMSEHGYIGGSALDKVKVAVAGGAAPDVVYINAGDILAEAIGDNLCIPLDEIIDQSFLKSIPYLPAPQGYVIHDGRMYGLQFRSDSRGLYFNVDLFEEAGFDSSVGPKDTAELDLYAARLTKVQDDGKIRQLGFAPRGNNFADEMGWFWVFGGSIYDPVQKIPTLTGNPAHLRTLEWILSYAIQYGPTARTGSTQFANRETAMLVQSTTWLPQFPERAPDLRWSVSHIPYPAGGRKTTYSSGMGAIVPRGAKNIQGAVEFIKYLAQMETQVKWYHLTRQLPARGDALQALLRGREITDPRERVMVELLPYAEGTPPLFTIVRPEFGQNLTRMRTQEMTPQQVLEDTQRAVEPRYRALFGK